jgi:hypothetical protein
MTLYVETVDYLPRTYPQHDDGVPPEVDVNDWAGVPSPIVLAIERLTLGEEGAGRCSRPDCDNMIGWYLTETSGERGDVEYAAWSFVTLVWDDTETITNQGAASGADPVRTRPVLTLCEDHSPEDPYDTIRAAADDIETARLAAERRSDRLTITGEWSDTALGWHPMFDDQRHGRAWCRVCQKPCPTLPGVDYTHREGVASWWRQHVEEAHA